MAGLPYIAEVGGGGLVYSLSLGGGVRYGSGSGGARSRSGQDAKGQGWGGRGRGLGVCVVYIGMRGDRGMGWIREGKCWCMKFSGNPCINKSLVQIICFWIKHFYFCLNIKQ